MNTHQHSINKIKINKRYQGGFTLTELMITIGIMAIALGLAAPSLTDFIENNRMTTTANKLVSAINYARNEAVSRRENVRISGDDSGWWVDVVPLTTSTTQRIADYNLDQNMVLRISDNSVSGITFSPSGFRDMSAAPSSFFFTVCNPANNFNRIVTVNAAGTTTVTKGTTGCPSP